MKCPMPKCVNGEIPRLLEGCILATYVDKFDPCPNCGPDGWATKWARLATEDAYLSYGSSDPSAPPVTDDMLPGESENFDAIATAARKRLEERDDG